MDGCIFTDHSAQFVFSFKKRYPTLGSFPVSWVRLRKNNSQLKSIKNQIKSLRQSARLAQWLNV